jgi:hypothetical protein
MPATDIGEEDVYAGLTEDLLWTCLLSEADGATAAKLAAEDIVHFVLSERIRGEPGDIVLDITNTAANENGSRVFIESLGTVEPHVAANGYIRLAQADTDAIVDAWAETIRSVRYVGEMYYLDDSETNPADAKKLMARGTIHLHRSGAQS